MARVSDNPLVTVICSTFNSRDTLRCALRSVLNQELADFEVRIIGDACTDGTERVVDELNDARLHWFNRATNSGSQSEPNNEGLRRARGRYVAFLGHDDLWFPWHLSRLVAHLEKTGADLVHDLLASVRPEGIDGVFGPPHERSDYTRTLFPPSSWLHRRELPDAIGYWRPPEALAWTIDYDFTRRAAVAGKKIAFLPSLGGLKFYSAAWRNYSRTGPPPQEPYLERILDSPAPLAETVLAELAARLARNSATLDKRPLRLACAETAAAAKGVLWACVRGAIQLYGDERWPMNGLLRRRMQRLRTELRAQRGLPGK